MVCVYGPSCECLAVPASVLVREERAKSQTVSRSPGVSPQKKEGRPMGPSTPRCTNPWRRLWFFSSIFVVALVLLSGCLSCAFRLWGWYRVWYFSPSRLDPCLVLCLLSSISLSLSLVGLIAVNVVFFSFSGAGETQARCGLGLGLREPCDSSPRTRTSTSTHSSSSASTSKFCSRTCSICFPADARLLGLGVGFSGSVGLACIMHCMQ